tara:strand:- start:66 stop:275 length:210 start_codon:yes stop_codon:yes gene_type:complete
MALTKKLRLEKLQKVKTSDEFYDLYLEVFGEEFPIIETLDPTEKMETLIYAIENNEKVKEVKLGQYTNI